MKILIPPEKRKIFDKLPRDRPPFSEIAAVQTFKLMGWATATAGIYVLRDTSDSFGLRLIPWMLAILIIWDMSAKLGYEPEIERSADDVHVIISWWYVARLALVMALSTFAAWAVVFWLAPLIHLHILSAR